MRQRLSNLHEECHNFWVSHGLLVMVIGYALACLTVSTWCVWDMGMFR